MLWRGTGPPRISGHSDLSELTIWQLSFTAGGMGQGLPLVAALLALEGRSRLNGPDLRRVLSYDGSEGRFRAAQQLPLDMGLILRG